MSEHLSESVLRRVLFEQSLDAQLIFDESGILECNQALVDMLGVADKSLLIGRHPAEFSPEFQADGKRSSELQIEVDRRARERGFHRFDWIHQRVNGETFLCEVSLTVVQLNTGHAILAAWHDVSERKAAQEELERIRTRLELALSGGDVGLWDWDMDTDEVYYSDQFHRQIGEPPGTLSQYIDWQSRVHIDDLAAAEERLKVLFASNRNHYESTFRLRHSSGEYRWIFSRGQLFRDPEGRPKRLLGIHLNITVQKENEQRLNADLHRSEIMLQTLESTLRTTSLEDLCRIVCDQTRCMIGAHIAGVDLYRGHCTTVELHERSYSFKYQSFSANKDALDDVAACPFFNTLSRIGCVSQEEMQTNPDTWNFCTATPFRPSLRGLLACPLTDGDGKTLGAIWLSDKEIGDFNPSDQSVLRQLAYIVSILIVRLNAESQLRSKTELLDASNEELKQFAYAASHDLQQPLRAISNYAEFLHEDYAAILDEQGKRFLQLQIAAAKRMKKLIDDLLQYSRVSRDETDRSEVDFQNVVHEAMRMLDVDIEESGAEVRFEHLPVVRGIESRLAQLMQNLISNAIKYRSDAAPIITIRVIENSTHWEFEVSDNGIGIDPKFHAEIFQVFRRLHDGNKIEGTGIGLALCKRIVQRHGGEIWVESGPGSGSSFYFQISK